MKIVEITNNIKLPITNEEADLLAKFSEEVSIAKNQLDERQQVIANQLVIKDVLSRRNQDGKIFYKKKISD